MIKPSRMMVDKLIRHFRANENMESCRREGKRVRGSRQEAAHGRRVYQQTAGQRRGPSLVPPGSRMEHEVSLNRGCPF